MKYKILKFIIVFLLVFTLPFKFGIIRTGKEYAFPIIVPVAIGLIELLSAVLILNQKTFKKGLILALCVFGGAIFAHLFVIGIGYGTIMFPLALLGFFSSLVLINKK